MVSKYCAVNTLQTKTQQKHCNLCKKHTYQLQGNQTYPLLFDEECFMHILQANPTNYLDDTNTFKKLGITQYSVRFTTETKQEVKEIINQVKL